MQPQQPDIRLQKYAVDYESKLKRPLHQHLGTTTEVIMGTFNMAINELATLKVREEDYNQEILRLRDLCEKNNIDWKVSTTVETQAKEKPKDNTKIERKGAVGQG